MSDNNTKCPLCGKNKNDGEDFCHECREIANAYPEDFFSSEEKVSESHLQEKRIEETDLVKDPVSDYNLPPHKDSRYNNKKLYIFVAITIGVLLVVGAIAAYLRKNQLEAKENEIAYWNQSIEENTPSAYSKYLIVYPEGQFSEEAHKKIREIREQERNSWKKIRHSNDVDKLFAFLADYPQTPYQKDARQLIDSLVWQQALADNTAESFKAYMENAKLEHYEGDYYEIALEKYEYLASLKPVEENEFNEVRDAVINFYTMLSSLDAKKLQAYSSPSFEKLYNAINQTPEYLVDSIKQYCKKEKIRSISYTPLNGLMEVIKDGKGIYYVTVPVKSELTYSSRNKKKGSSEHMTLLELDDKKMIRSLYLKE